MANLRRYGLAFVLFTLLPSAASAVIVTSSGAVQHLSVSKGIGAAEPDYFVSFTLPNPGDGGIGFTRETGDPDKLDLTFILSFPGNIHTLNVVPSLTQLFAGDVEVADGNPTITMSGEDQNFLYTFDPFASEGLTLGGLNRFQLLLGDVGNTVGVFFTTTRASVPEPAALALFGLGAIGLALRTRKA